MRTLFLLVLIVLLGATLRFRGLGYDLPNVYNLDEPSIMNKAIEVAEGKFQHGRILRGSIPFYAIGGTIRIIVRLYPRLADNTSISEAFQRDKTVFYVIGRSISALYSTIEILLLFCLTSLILSPQVGLLASFLLSVAPLAVRSAHDISPNSAVSATMLFTILTSLYALRRGKWYAFLLAGLLSGFSAAQKIPGVTTLPFVIACTFLAQYTSRSSLRTKVVFIVTIAFLSIIAYILSYPFFVRDFHKVVTEWRFEMGNVINWDRPPRIDFGIIFRIRESALWLRIGIGTFIYYFSILGLLLCLKRRNTILIIIGCYAIVFFWANTIPVKLDEFRYVALIPVICLFAAYALSYVLPIVSSSVFLTLILFISIAPMFKSLFIAQSYASVSTQTQKLAWLRNHGVDESALVSDPFTKDESDFTSDPSDHVYPQEKNRYIHTQQIPSLLNYSYAVINSEFAGWYYYWEKYQPVVHDIADVYRYIEAHGTIIAEFIPQMTVIDEEDLDFLLHANRWVYHQIRGPKITIYKLQ